MLKMKTILNGRQPQNVKIEIFVQPLVGSSQSFKVESYDQTEVYKCIKWRLPSIEDCLKISEWGISAILVESYSNLKLKLYVSKPKFTSPSEKDDLHWKTISKY